MSWVGLGAVPLLSLVLFAVHGVFATAGPEAATMFAFNGTPGSEASTVSNDGQNNKVVPFGEHIADQSLVDYLVKNRAGAKFLVATQGALVAAPFIFDKLYQLW